MLHKLHAVGYMPSACRVLPSRLRNIKTPCNSSHTSTWTPLYHLSSVFLSIDIFINVTLSCNANVAKCTGISQCLVNSSKHSAGRYSAVLKRHWYSATAWTSFSHSLIHSFIHACLATRPCPLPKQVRERPNASSFKFQCLLVSLTFWRRFFSSNFSTPCI